jgi:hypothetical protein
MIGREYLYTSITPAKKKYRHHLSNAGLKLKAQNTTTLLILHNNIIRLTRPFTYNIK